MPNRLIDWIAAAVFMGAMALACASPAPGAYQRAIECPHYDCGEE